MTTEPLHTELIGSRSVRFYALPDGDRLPWVGFHDLLDALCDNGMTKAAVLAGNRDNPRTLGVRTLPAAGGDLEIISWLSAMHLIALMEASGHLPPLLIRFVFGKVHIRALEKLSPGLSDSEYLALYAAATQLHEAPQPAPTAPAGVSLH